MSNVQLPADLALHAGFVRRLARALTHDAGTVDDLVQEAWITAQGHGASARRGRPWLGSVVRNLARRRWRTDVRRSVRERVVARSEALPGSDAVLARQELLEALVVALRGLDEPYRGTILARFYEDLPPR